MRKSAQKIAKTLPPTSGGSENPGGVFFRGKERGGGAPGFVFYIISTSGTARTRTLCPVHIPPHGLQIVIAGDLSAES